MSCCCGGVPILHDDVLPAFWDIFASSMRSLSFSIFSALFSTCPREASQTSVLGPEPHNPLCRYKNLPAFALGMSHQLCQPRHITRSPHLQSLHVRVLPCAGPLRRLPAPFLDALLLFLNLSLGLNKERRWDVAKCIVLIFSW